MKYKVITKTRNINKPDNNIWDSDSFAELIEAENAEEAIALAIDYTMDNSNWELINTLTENVSADYENGWIEYKDEDGEEFDILFRAEEVAKCF